MKNTKLLILTGIVAGVALPSLLIAQDLLDGDLGVEFSENAAPLAIEKKVETPTPPPAAEKPAPVVKTKAAPTPVTTKAVAPAKPVVAPKTPVATPVKATTSLGTPTPAYSAPVAVPVAAPITPSVPTIELPDESEFLMIDGVPFGTTLAAFKSALQPAAEATFEVYNPEGGVRPATDLKAGYIVRVTAGDQVSVSWYKVVFAPNTDPSFTSKLGKVDEDLGVLGEVPFGTSLADLMVAVVPAPEASCQVFQPDGLTVATDVLEGYLLNCTAGDMVTQKTVSISFAANTDAGVETPLGTVNEDKKTITEIPFGTSLADFKASLVGAPQTTLKVLKSDALTEADTLKTGYFLMVTAGDKKHQKKYRIEYAPNTDASVQFSLDTLIKMLTGKK